MNRFKMTKKELQPLFKAYKGRIVFAYLFGTAASHDYSPLSDIDLAFYVDSMEDTFNLKLALYADCTRLLKRNDIDIIILNNLRNLILADEIVNNGTVIFDSNPEVRLDYEVRIHHQVIDFIHQRKMIMGVWKRNPVNGGIDPPKRSPAEISCNYNYNYVGYFVVL